MGDLKVQTDATGKVVAVAGWVPQQDYDALTARVEELERTAKHNAEDAAEWTKRAADTAKLLRAHHDHIGPGLSPLSCPVCISTRKPALAARGVR